MGGLYADDLGSFYDVGNLSIMSLRQLPVAESLLLSTRLSKVLF